MTVGTTLTPGKLECLLGFENQFEDSKAAESSVATEFKYLHQHFKTWTIIARRGLGLFSMAQRQNIDKTSGIIQSEEHISANCFREGSNSSLKTSSIVLRTTGTAEVGVQVCECHGCFRGGRRRRKSANELMVEHQSFAARRQCEKQDSSTVERKERSPQLLTKRLAAANEKYESTQSEETQEETLFLARLCPPCHPLCRSSKIPIEVKDADVVSPQIKISQKLLVIRISTITQNSRLHFGSPKISHDFCLYLQKR